ncbi:unnamed protein product, partial [Polarella glacialis]
DSWVRSVRPVLISVDGASTSSSNNNNIALGSAIPMDIAPGQAVRLPVPLAVTGAGGCGGTSGVAERTLELAVEGLLKGKLIRSPSIRVSIRCRTGRQNFVFTFEDDDGSLQHAAAVMPLGSGGVCEGGCPVLLTLHGTSISASDSADSYKAKLDTDYRFGVESAWLLAPTRHGAHNWEGPGHAAALAALRALPKVAAKLGVQEPDIGRVLVAGHSMGGHGSWLLASALRDQALGLASSASWLRKDQYADSNKVMLHDIAAADVELALLALMRSAEAEFEVESQAPTLAGGLPIMMRVGSRDQTVHPWFSRRMFRTLLAAGASSADVTLTEIKGKEHWWWDTETSNDGGVVNDEQLRAFFRKCLARASGPAALSESWRLVVFNPAFSGAKGGARILQQMQPHRRSELSVQVSAAKVEVHTSNVRRLEWDLHALSVLACGSGGCASARPKLMLDGQLQVLGMEGKSACWCLLGSASWAECEAEAALPPTERGPRQVGPMRRLFSAPVCAIFGSDAVGQSAALFVSNMMLMSGHGHLRLVPASEGALLHPQSARTSLWWARLT